MRVFQRHLACPMVMLSLLAVSLPLPAAPPTGDQPPSSSQSASATAPGPAGLKQIRGIAMQLANPDEARSYDAMIEEIAQTGANTVSLSLAAYQDDAKSPVMVLKPDKMPSDSRLKAVIALAHRRGLRVVLLPIVLLEHPGEGEWRGKIDPTKGEHNWDDWWGAYERYILHYARLADEAGADVFVVGSELISTEGQTDRWEKLIAKVRGAYHGPLGYSANWDHYKAVTFWGKLDLVGMSTYYDLSHGKEPTLEVLMDSWRPIKKEILDWQATVRLPLVFTEVGWPNQVTAAEFPWDYYRSVDKPDPQLQKLCFEAFFQTWAQEKAMGGYLVWEWRTHPAQDTSPKADTGYCPRGKPAMAVIEKYFRMNLAGSQPATTSTAPSTTRAATQPR